MTVEAILSVLLPPGASERKLRSTPDLIAYTRKGIPASILTQLATKLDIDRKEVAKTLGISERTLSRRLHTNSQLTTDESDRAVRLARVFAKASDTFGEQGKAARWLQSSNRALDGSTPFELLDTDAGVESVLTVLGRIDYGVYS